MNKEKNDLGSFLQKNSKNSNKELADNIRGVKKLSNSHDNVVNHQEKKSICSTAEKLLKSIRCFDENAELIIKTNNKEWKQG